MAKPQKVNLSVSETGSANSQVSKGDVKVGGNGQKTETVTEGGTKALSTSSAAPPLMEIQGPRSGSSIPLTSLSDKLNLSWSNVPAGTLVFLETGSSRDNLVRSSTGTPSEARKLAANLPAGDFFWRLVAVKDGKIVSAGPTNFNQSVVLETPKLLSSVNNEKIIIKQDAASPEVRLSWTRPQGAEDVTVFLAKDSEFKNIVSSKTFISETEWRVPVKESGKYFWRTSVRWPGVERRVFSGPGAFEVTKQKDVPAPVVDAKTNDAVYSKQVIDANGMLMSWTGQQGVDSYNLTLEQMKDKNFKPLFTKNISGNQFRMTNIPAGSYRWSVRAKMGDAESAATSPIGFSVVEIPRMSLKNPVSENAPITFESADSPVSMSLASLPASAARIRFKIASADQDLKSAAWQQSPADRPMSFKLPGAGSYKLLAEATDASGKTVAMTDVIPFAAKAPDRLPAPTLLTGNQKLKTGEAGDIILKWKPVPGAVRYIVEINGPKTKFRKEVNTTSQKLNGIYPGEHTLTLTAIDKAGRSGTPGPGITLSVPDVSSIAAPTTKGIKIR